MKESIRCFIDPARICPGSCDFNREIQESYKRLGIKGITRIIGGKKPSRNQKVFVVGVTQALMSEGNLEKCKTYTKQQSIQPKRQVASL